MTNWTVDVHISRIAFRNECFFISFGSRIYNLLNILALP